MATLIDTISEPFWMYDREIQDELCRPLKERLETIKALRKKNQKKSAIVGLNCMPLERLPKMNELKDKKLPLDKIIAELRAQQVKLEAELEPGTITNEYIVDVLEFAAKVRGNLDLMDSDYEEKRWLPRALRVKVINTEENGERIIEVSCRLGKEKLSIAVTTLQQNTRGSSAMSGQYIFDDDEYSCRHCFITKEFRLLIMKGGGGLAGSDLT